MKRSRIDYFKILKRKLFYSVSPQLRLYIRRVYYLPIDVFEFLSNSRDPMTPPRGMNNVGPGEFKKTGELLLSHIIEYGGLMPSHRILDLGCGIGRLAVPLTKYLNKEGSYEGLDIVKPAIKWCQNRITPLYPNFKFTHVDIRNSLYNLSTDLKAKDFQFPYPDNQFDVVVATSLFTHMDIEDSLNYLHEIFRVLKNGGYCYASFFILTEESKVLMLENDEFNFKFNYGNYKLMDSRVKEANIAIEESYLIDYMIPQSNLALNFIYPGFWSGRSKDKSLDFQDTVILKKESYSNLQSHQ